MASTASTFAVSSPSGFVNGKAHCQLVPPSPQGVTLPALSPRRTLRSKNRLRRSTVHGEPVSIVLQLFSLQTLVFPKHVCEIDVDNDLCSRPKQSSKCSGYGYWRYSRRRWRNRASSLGVASLIAVWGSTGLISAIDRLPIVPGILELVGIGYTGWFVYKNLVFKPDREALIEKITETYKDVTGGS